MIAEVLKFLRGRLNEALPRDSDGGAAEDLFVYVNADKDDAVSFKANAVTVLLVRIEEEKTLRQPDSYTRKSTNRVAQRVAPEIRMNLWVLFVARFPDDYGRALRHLSDVIAYFQNHRVFNQDVATELNEDVQQLVLELVTPSFSEQNEIWAALRSPYQPSALYKVKMIVFRDAEPKERPPVKELIQSVGQAPSPGWKPDVED